MCWQDEIALPSGAASVHEARAFCTRRLGALLGDQPGADDIAADAELIVSELVSNAVNAASTQTTLILTVHHDHLRVAVEDDAAGEPAVRHPSQQQPQGRGLQIVERLSGAWGVTRTDRGKQVWADLALTAELTSHLLCELPRA
jgi:anti-sigma regulatory factor (Ser/Thr protein kinase)